MAVPGPPARTCLRLLALASIVLSVAVAARAGDEDRSSFRVETLKDGVHLFRPPADQPRWVNSLVVEREDGVLVVAAQPDPEAARRLLETIDRRIGAPVRYLVLPHSHADVAGGASAFSKSVLVVATDRYRQALSDATYDFGAEARLSAPDPDAWVEPPRRAPTLVIAAFAELDDPRNPVSLLPLGQVHSSGDLLVTVGGEDVYYCGAVLFPDRAPYAGDTRVEGWIAALANLQLRAPRVAVPLRGEPIGVDELREEHHALAWLQGEVGAGLGERLDRDRMLEQIRSSNAARFDTHSAFFEALVDEVTRQIQAARARR